MKNLSLILNIILSIAVAGIYFFHFSSDSVETTEVAGQIEGEKSKSGFTIAYIQSDSLVKNYQFVIDEQKKIEARTRQVEQDFRNRAEKLQKDFEDYQMNMRNLTIAQARAKEEDLGKREQNLRVFQERVRQELVGLETETTRELYTLVTEFLEKYSEENKIDMVVKFDPTSDVLFAGKGLDITQTVIDKLNQEYKEKLEGTDSTGKGDSTKVN